jgi:hypothetical protein
MANGITWLCSYFNTVHDHTLFTIDPSFNDGVKVRKSLWSLASWMPWLVWVESYGSSGFPSDPQSKPNPWSFSSLISFYPQWIGGPPDCLRRNVVEERCRSTIFLICPFWYDWQGVRRQPQSCKRLSIGQVHVLHWRLGYWAFISMFREWDNLVGFL